MLVGICGSMRAGKDTLAMILKDLLEAAGSEAEVYKFASPMKTSILKAINVHTNMGLEYKDIDGESSFDREQELFSRIEAEVILRSALGLSELFFPIDFDSFLEDKTYSTRELLQLFGTEVVKDNCSDDYWVDLLKDYHKGSELSKVIIVPDVRFDNEFRAMDEVYWIRRDSAEEANTSDHISEKGITDYTGAVYVDNNGTIDDLRTKLYKVLF